MNTRPVSLNRLGLLGLAALAALPAADVRAQTATAVTNPVGYLQTTCLGNSDTLVALPFTRMPAFTGAVASVSGTGGSTVSIANTPSFTANQFVQNLTASPAQTDTFYLTVGPATATLTGTLTLTVGSAAVAGSGTAFTTQLAVGDRLTVNDGYNLLTYTVTAITDASNLTLDRAFSDAALPGGSAVIPVADAARKTVTATLVKKSGKPVALAQGAALSPIVGPVKLPTATGTAFSGLSATFDHSPLEGRWYIVSANDTGSVTVALNGDSLNSLAAGTQVSIIPCWTLNTLLPNGGGLTNSASSHSVNSKVLVPNYAATGINISAATIYYYIVDASDNTNFGWRSIADGPRNDHGNDYLLPDGYVTVRQDNNATTSTLTFNGSVPVNKLAATLSTATSQYQDNPVGLTRPADTTLNGLGFNPPNNGSFQISTSSHNIQDRVLVYDNTTASTNKSASTIYYYLVDATNSANSGWRSIADGPSNEHGNEPVNAGSALTIRKAPTANGQSVVWSNVPNY